MEPNLFVWGNTTLMLADHQLLWLGVQTLSWDKTRDLTSISMWERDEKEIRRVIESCWQGSATSLRSCEADAWGDPMRGS